MGLNAAKFQIPGFTVFELLRENQLQGGGGRGGGGGGVGKITLPQARF